MRKSKKLTYSEKKEIYFDLQRTMVSASCTALVDKFREKLKNAIAQGYPVDFEPRLSKWHCLLQEMFYVDRKMQPEILKVLLDAGTDVEITDNRGRNALMEAVLHNAHACVTEELAKRTEDIDKKDVFGTTALLLACNKFLNKVQRSGYEEYIDNVTANIKVLLGYGADPKINDYLKDYSNAISIYNPRMEEKRAMLNKIIWSYLGQKESLRDTEQELEYEYEL